MAAVIIGNPGIGGVNAASTNDRYAGVGTVRSDGTVALRKEAGLIVQQGFTDVPTYVATFNVAAVSAMDIFTLGSIPNTTTRLLRVVIVNPGSATAAALVDLQLGRVPNGFGSGGVLFSGFGVDAYARTEGVSGGPDSNSLTFGHVGDTTQVGGFVALYNPVVTISVPAAAGAFTPLVIYDARDSRVKPITISGLSSGNLPSIVLRTPAIGAGATGLRGYFEFTLENA